MMGLCVAILAVEICVSIVVLRAVSWDAQDTVLLSVTIVQECN